MQRKWEGKLVGEFLGYAHGRVYELSNGEIWRQDDGTDEPCWRDGPGARLFWEQSIGAWWLDIDGTSAVVRVMPGAPRRGAGAF